MAAFRLSRKTDKGILRLYIPAAYQIYGFFSAKPENIEKFFWGILQLKIPVVDKFNKKPTYYLFSCDFAVCMLVK